MNVSLHCDKKRHIEFGGDFEFLKKKIPLKLDNLST
jgi:hypothetical protein